MSLNSMCWLIAWMIYVTHEIGLSHSPCLRSEQEIAYKSRRDSKPEYGPGVARQRSGSTVGMVGPTGFEPVTKRL